MGTEKNIISQSFTDLHEDFAEREYLVWDLKTKLERLNRYKNISLLTKQVYKILHQQIEQLHKSVSQTKNKIRSDKKNEENLVLLIRQKTQISNNLRSLSQVISALIVSPNYMSPSYMSSQIDQSGWEKNRIKLSLSDYKRDWHQIAADYERTFIREYIQYPIKQSLSAYAVSSGMAAFTTIINWLQMNNAFTQPVILGQSTYFEAKDMLSRFVKSKLIEVSEDNTGQIIKQINEYKPQAVFFDSLTNSPIIKVPDINQVIIHLKILSKTQPVYLILDNTCMPLYCQPLKNLYNPLSNLHIIVYESLNKFHQFGWDRISGGIIWGLGKYSSGLFDIRKHLGTNIDYAACLALPTPNKIRLEKRLRRLERNNLILAQALSSVITAPKSLFNHVSYPGLVKQSINNNTADTLFNGVYFMLIANGNNQKSIFYKRFTQKVINQAGKFKIPLAAGTSFGLDTTRIYPTALYSKVTNPFLRISTGTETLWEIEKLKKLFGNIL